MMSTVRLCAVAGAPRRDPRGREQKRTEIFVGGRTDEFGLAQRKKSPPKVVQMIDHPPQLLKEMTSSAAFRCVQAWLLEKPAAWADDLCLAAAQMAQRPPNKRPREDALLEASTRTSAASRSSTPSARTSGVSSNTSRCSRRKSNALRKGSGTWVKSRTRWTTSLKRLFTASHARPAGRACPALV